MHAFDPSWTLFLDRDGVLNVEKEGDYIRCWEEFMFLPRVLDALAILKGVFGRIIIVTNQRGVGRGLMTMADLNHIHQRMKAVIKASGGRIDAIYACTALENDNPCRKPNPGMAYQAKRDFPEIEFHRSVMVGNSESDMLFGRSLGMRTVWISTKSPLPSPPDLADEVYESLWTWTLSLQGR